MAPFMVSSESQGPHCRPLSTQLPGRPGQTASAVINENSAHVDALRTVCQGHMEGVERTLL